jgi:predicted dehydrogenase
MEFPVRHDDEPLPIAIVGAGAITRAAHLPAALRSRLTELVALVDSRPANAKDLVHSYRLNCKVVSDLTDVIDTVNAVIIATPPDTHYRLAQFALSNGVHVLVEKPMTTLYADAIRLADLAKREHKVLAVGYYSRCYPSIALMKQLIDTGFFGEILGFTLEQGSTSGWAPVSGYNLDRRQSGGGELISTGTYFIDRLLYWFGTPKSFVYLDDSYGGPEANCKAELRYDNEIGRFSGSIFISKTIGLKNKFILDTEKYVCERQEAQTRSLTLYPKDNPELRMELFPNIQLPHPEPDYYQVQLERFVGCIQGRCTVPVDGSAGAQSVKLIEDMYRHKSRLEEPWLRYRQLRSEGVVED